MKGTLKIWRGRMTVSRAAEGIDRRLADTLVGTGWALTPVAVREVRQPAAAGEFRLQRGRLLRDLPASVQDVLTVYHRVWHSRGYRVRDHESAEDTLVAEDAAGYVLTVGRVSADELLLTATSPPVRDPDAAPTPSRYALLWIIGLACGAVPQILLMAPVVAAPPGPQRQTATMSAIFNLYVLPATLVISIALLVRPSTRPAGAGLLTGAAAAALIFAGVCTAATRPI